MGEYSGNGNLIMAIPEFTKKLVETKLERYCQTKIPEYPRNFGKIGFKFDSNIVTIFQEGHPRNNPSNKFLHINIAQFRYSEKENEWILYCYDTERSIWRLYMGAEREADFEYLLNEVDKDGYGIFWSSGLIFWHLEDEPKYKI